MRLVHLTASGFFGGPERQILGLCQALRRPQNGSREAHASLPPLATAADEPIHPEVLLFPERGHAQSFATQLQQAGLSHTILTQDVPQVGKVLRELTDELKRRRPEVLFCHGYKANLLGSLAAGRAEVRCVAVSRGWTWDNWKVRAYQWLDRCWLKRFEHVIAVSQGQADKVHACGVPRERISVIYNSARLDAFDPSSHAQARQRLEACFPRQRVPRHILLAGGRFSPEKGWPVLLQAMAILRSALPDVGLLLFGDGDQRRLLENLRQQLGLQDQVLFPGFTTQLDRCLTGASAVVLSSYTEGLPNILLEAAAAGLPSVATAVGGVPELIQHEQTGYLVPPGDPTALAGALAALLMDSARRQAMGQAARRHMEQNFTFAAQAQAYRAWLRRCLPERPAQLRALGPTLTPRIHPTEAAA